MIDALAALWTAAQPKIAAVAQTALRLALAVPFFKSGLTKWDGFFQLSDSADTLFAEEFKLHLFGQLYDFPAPHVLAFASGSGEIFFPILLVLGLATRFAAVGILGMTAIIQLTIPEGWANFHLIWAASALALLAWGPGPLALDRLLGKRIMYWISPGFASAQSPSTQSETH